MKVYIIPTIFIILIIGNVIYHVVSDSNAVINEKILDIKRKIYTFLKIKKEPENKKMTKKRFFSLMGLLFITMFLTDKMSLIILATFFIVMISKLLLNFDKISEKNGIFQDLRKRNIIKGFLLILLIGTAVLFSILNL
jgi:hypothetical protein